MMALPISPASTVPSQPADTPTAFFPQPAPNPSTPNIDATNAFRPSIPQKNSRIPAVEIDKLSLPKSNNHNNGKSMPIGTSVLSTGGVQPSLPPPPLPPHPIKGINNTQARTARKSAPSSSNRGDGYSTSSSGGGKESISSGGKNKEKRDRESLINEVPVTPVSGTDVSSLTRSPQSQSQLSASPEQSFVATQFHFHHKLEEKLRQQRVQLSLENGDKPQQKETMSAVVPAPPSFAGPSTQVTGVKRPAPPAIPLAFPSMVSGKPKRQKIATAKAAALASEAGMNADGSVVKKRKPRKNASEKGGKEKEKPGRGKAKEPKALDMFVAVLNNHLGCQPILPPRYQKPNTQQEQGKKDTNISRAAASGPVAGGIKPGFPGPQTLITPSGIPTISQTNGIVSATQMQTPIVPRQIPDDVISISSSPPAPIPYHTPGFQSDDKGRQGRDELGSEPVPKANQQGRCQSTPIAIDDVCSEAEGVPGSGRSPGGNSGKDSEPVVVKINETKKLDTTGHSNFLGSPELMQVSDEFFVRCLSASDDERAKILVEIETFIMVLSAEVKKHLPSFCVDHYLQCQQDSPAVAKITARLKHMGVLTTEGKVITLDEWKCSGMPKFQGRFILPGYSQVRSKTPDTEKSESDTSPSGEAQASRGSNNKIKDVVDAMDINSKQTVAPVEVSAKPQGYRVINGDTSPDGNEQAMTKEFTAIGKQKEDWGPANGSSQPVEVTSPPPKLPASPLPSEPATSTENQAPQPQSWSGQKPLSPSNQIQAEADASVTNIMLTSDVSETPTPSPVSGKGKRKAFATPTVENFLKESIAKQQERNDQLLMKILALNKSELSFRSTIDALAVESKKKEREFERRITAAKVGAKVSVDDEKLDSELGIMAASQIDWEGFRKVTKELMDFQDEIRREELRLANQAARIAEEKQDLIERRKRLRRESEPDTTPSCTSEERSLDNGDSTTQSSAPSSVAGFSGMGQEFTPSVDVGAKARYPELGVGHELLQALIPWAKQLEEMAGESSAFTETGTHQMKPKKKPIRRKRHW